MGDDISKDKNASKDAPSKSKAPSKGSKASTAAKKPSPGKSTKTTVKPAAKASTAEGLGLPQQVDLVWTIALVALAFVIGFLIRGLFPSAEPGTTIPPSSSLSAPSGAGGAPSLSEEQMNNGQLPASHPAIGGTDQSTATPAPSTGAQNAPVGHGGTGVSGDPMGNVKSDVPAAGDVPAGGQSVEVKPGEDKK